MICTRYDYRKGQFRVPKMVYRKHSKSAFVKGLIVKMANGWL